MIEVDIVTLVVTLVFILLGLFSCNVLIADELPSTPGEHGFVSVVVVLAFSAVAAVAFIRGVSAGEEQPSVVEEVTVSVD